MRKKLFPVITTLGIAGLIVGGGVRPLLTSAIVPGDNTLISVNNSGNAQGGNGHSSAPKVAANGRFVAFDSVASDLVQNDTNSKKDVFIRDLTTQSTKRVSISSSNIEADNDSTLAAISETGRYVLFNSKASNLIDGEIHSALTEDQVYIFDNKTEQTTILTKNTSNQIANSFNQGAGLSADGRFIVINSNSTNLVSGTTNTSIRRVLAFDRDTNSWSVLSKSSTGSLNENSQNAQMNCDGSMVVFQSSYNLDGQGTTGSIYLLDRRSGDKIKKIDIGANSSSTFPKISCNGNFIGFQSHATNLVPDGPVPSQYSGQHLIRYDLIDDSFCYVDVDSSGQFFTTGTFGDGLADRSGLAITDDGNVGFVRPITYGSAPVNTLFVRNIRSGVTEKINKNPYRSLFLTPLSFDTNGRSILLVGNDISGMVSGDSNGYNDVISAKTGW